jgi:hypothetical protein
MGSIEGVNSTLYETVIRYQTRICLHKSLEECYLQGCEQNGSACWAYSDTLKMEAECLFETSVNLYQTIERLITVTAVRNSSPTNRHKANIKILPFSTASGPVMGPTQPPIQWVRGLILGHKAAGA